jgi:cold shock CspA family protein
MVPRSGKVVAFDDHRGWGEVEDEDGGRHPFHCTRIAGGTRSITVGTPVVFTIAPGLPGQWEAVDIRPRPT